MTGVLPAGERIGRWTIEDALGSGACGTVYRAVPVEGGAPCALKLLHAPSPERSSALDRFLRESALLARVHHPRVARWVEAVVDGDRMAIVSELVMGESLDRLIHRSSAGAPRARGHGRGLDPALALQIMSDVTDGLMHLHEQRIVHRDLKPSNVIVGPDGRTCLVDFGLAHAVGEETLITCPGQVRATLMYTAPEILLRQGPSPASDLYSLGLIGLEMLTGSVPFPHRSLAGIASAQLGEQPPSVSSRRPGLSCWWDRVLEKLLAKEPSMRYRSASDLFKDLEALATQLSPMVGPAAS